MYTGKSGKYAFNKGNQVCFFKKESSVREQERRGYRKEKGESQDYGSYRREKIYSECESKMKVKHDERSENT